MWTTLPCSVAAAANAGRKTRSHKRASGHQKKQNKNEQNNKHKPPHTQTSAGGRFASGKDSSHRGGTYKNPGPATTTASAKAIFAQQARRPPRCSHGACVRAALPVAWYMSYTPTPRRYPKTPSRFARRSDERVQ